jgi:hypothetical protein
MNKKGVKGSTIAIILILALLVVAVGVVVYMTSTSQQAIQKQAEIVTNATTSGDYAQISVKVHDISALNENTQIAVPVYCVDDLGNVIIDGTSSSTSADIKGSTARNRVISCYAFNSTVQTSTANTKGYWDVAINQDSVPIVIDAYTVATVSLVKFYNKDGTVSGTDGLVNVTGVGADKKVTLQKLYIENNQSYKWLPLAGVYVDKIANSNVTKVDFSGSASKGSFTDSSWGTRVSARSEIWNFVMSANGGANTLGTLNNAGIMPIMLEDGDSLTTGTVSVTGDGEGCNPAGTAESLTSYIFTSGFFRSQKTGAKPVQFGYETDASSSAVITADITGGYVGCTSGSA